MRGDGCGQRPPPAVQRDPAFPLHPFQQSDAGKDLLFRTRPRRQTVRNGKLRAFCNGRGNGQHARLAGALHHVLRNTAHGIALRIANVNHYNFLPNRLHSGKRTGLPSFPFHYTAEKRLFQG